MIAALLWDVDGTLAETERDGHRVAFNRAFASAGLPWDWNVRRYGELLRVTGGRERILADMATRPEAPPGAREREALARELHRRKNAHYAALVVEGRIALRPGVAQLIEDAASRGVPQAIVTTTSEVNVTALLAAVGGQLGTFRFAACVCGEHVAAKKPHPEAHVRALSQLGMTPARALAIEDAPAGAAAALAAGVPVIVTRSAYFEDDPVDDALAVGPGLHTRDGWRPAARGGAPGARVTLDDLMHWHANRREDVASG